MAQETKKSSFDLPLELVKKIEELSRSHHWSKNRTLQRILYDFFGIRKISAPVD